LGDFAAYRFLMNCPIAGIRHASYVCCGDRNEFSTVTRIAQSLDMFFLQVRVRWNEFFPIADILTRFGICF